MNSRGTLLAIGLCLSLLGSAKAATTKTDSTTNKPTAFTTVVRAHWKEWCEASGTITPPRLDHLMKRESIHGEEAAALAAMKRNSKDPTTKQLTDWTMKRIEDYEAQAASGKGKKSLDKAFKRALAAIKNDPHTLYTDGAPHLASIHQARSGDCWLLATIGAMIHRDPHQLRSFISDDGDRRYTVHFAYHKFQVNAPTDAEIGAFSSDKGDGDWLYVLENAVGQYRQDFTHLHHVSEANDDALVAGNGALAFGDLLGRSSDHVDMKPDRPQDDLVRATLSRAFNQRRLVILSTTHDKAMALPHGIAKGHAMAVIGWDAAADEVTVWNPWGNSSEPKATGPNGGYKTVNGVFTMPLTEFTKSFAKIYVENDKPYKPKKK